MPKKVYLYIILTALCFGTLEISGKIAGNNLDPFQFTFLRFIIGSTCMIPLAIGEQKERNAALKAEGEPAYRPSLKDILTVVASGIICVPLGMGSIQLGITMTNASTASVIVGTNGMLAMMFAHFIGGEKMSRTKWLYLLLALVGLTFMICPWNMQPGNTLVGSLLVLAGAMLFGLYTVIGKFAGRSMGSITQACSSMFIGNIFLWIFLLIAHRPVFANVPDNLGVVIYAGIVVTCGGYLFMFLTIKHANVQTSAISFFLKIAIAPLLSVIILSESLALNSYIGIACVLAASFLNLRENHRKAQSEKH